MAPKNRSGRWPRTHTNIAYSRLVNLSGLWPKRSSPSGSPSGAVFSPPAYSHWRRTC